MKLTYTIILLALVVIIARAQNSATSFTDPRDGQEYSIVEIGNLSWFASNLNYKIEGSYCFENDDKNCDIYGRLYKWEVALNACPQGWHLSTDFEWQELEPWKEPLQLLAETGCYQPEPTVS